MIITRRAILCGLAAGASCSPLPAPASSPFSSAEPLDPAYCAAPQEARADVVMRNLEHHLGAAALCLMELVDRPGSTWALEMFGRPETMALNTSARRYDLVDWHGAAIERQTVLLPRRAAPFHVDGTETKPTRNAGALS